MCFQKQARSLRKCDLLPWLDIWTNAGKNSNKNPNCVTENVLLVLLLIYYFINIQLIYNIYYYYYYYWNTSLYSFSEILAFLYIKKFWEEQLIQTNETVTVSRRLFLYWCFCLFYFLLIMFSHKSIYLFSLVPMKWIALYATICTLLIFFMYVLYKEHNCTNDFINIHSWSLEKFLSSGFLCYCNNSYLHSYCIWQ